MGGGKNTCEEDKIEDTREEELEDSFERGM